MFRLDGQELRKTAPGLLPRLWCRSAGHGSSLRWLGPVLKPLRCASAWPVDQLLPLALEVIKKSGIVQEYRRIWQPLGKVGADGMQGAKEVEHWELVAITEPRPGKIRVILLRVRDRQHHANPRSCLMVGSDLRRATSMRI